MYISYIQEQIDSTYLHICKIYPHIFCDHIMSQEGYTRKLDIGCLRGGELEDKGRKKTYFSLYSFIFIY